MLSLRSGLLPEENSQKRTLVSPGTVLTEARPHSYSFPSRPSRSSSSRGGAMAPSTAKQKPQVILSVKHRYSG